MEISNRIKEIKPYLFMEISRKIAAKKAEVTVNILFPMFLVKEGL